MSSQLLDTTYSVETPEGIDLYAELAGPVPRIMAYSIDILLRLVALGIVSALLNTVGKAGFGLILVIIFLVEWFYPVFFEVLNQGQTPGKKLMRLAVVNDDLAPVSWGTSIIRNLLRAADFLPFAYLGGLISMSINGRFQRLGDMAAGTLVIHRPNKVTAFDLPEVKPSAPPLALALEDQRAIIDFTLRHASLSTDRQQELARILIKNDRTDSVKYLHSWGVWLLGGR